MEQDVYRPSLLNRLYARLETFFATVPGAIQQHLNTEELSRISIAAMTAGGGIFGVLESIVLHSGTIFPAPIDASLAAFLLTLILETCRRLGQGEEPKSSSRIRRPGM